LLVDPSPKSQNRFVIVPVERSVKVTVKGFSPLVGLPIKFASGITAPTPVSRLVLPSSFNVVIVTTSLKLPSAEGVKRTTRLVEPKPGRLKGVPERIAKEVPAMLAEPLVIAAPPWFVRTRLC